MLFYMECIFNLISYKDENVWIAAIFVDGIALTCRPVFQCLISVERYLAVVHPVTFLKFKPLRYRVICSVIVWVASFVFGGIIIVAVFLFLRNFNYIFTYLPLLLHPVVLSCGCSQSSEAVRTRRERERERGGKPHEEKSILHYSNNFCDHANYIFFPLWFYQLFLV